MQKDGQQNIHRVDTSGADGGMARVGANAIEVDSKRAQGKPPWQQPWVRWLACSSVLFALAGLIGLSATWVVAERRSNRLLDRIALDARGTLPQPPLRSGTSSGAGKQAGPAQEAGQKNEAGPDPARQNGAPAIQGAADAFGAPADSSRELTRAAPSSSIPDQAEALVKPAGKRPLALKNTSCSVAPGKPKSAAARRAAPIASPAARARARRMRTVLERYRTSHPKKAAHSTSRRR